MSLLSTRIDDQKKTITIVLALTDPTASKSGKTLVVASTHGNQASGINLNGKAVIVGVNAYVRV